jgi:hypothetical protein
MGFQRQQFWQVSNTAAAGGLQRANSRVVNSEVDFLFARYPPRITDLAVHIRDASKGASLS